MCALHLCLFVGTCMRLFMSTYLWMCSAHVYLQVQALIGAKSHCNTRGRWNSFRDIAFGFKTIDCRHCQLRLQWLVRRMARAGDWLLQAPYAATGGRSLYFVGQAYLSWAATIRISDAYSSRHIKAMDNVRRHARRSSVGRSSCLRPT